LLPKATINLGAAGSPGRKTKDKKGGNLEYKQKVKNKGQLLLGGNPKATTNLCRCNG